MIEGILDLLCTAYPDGLDVTESACGLIVATIAIAVGGAAGTGSSCEQHVARIEELIRDGTPTLSWVLSAAASRRSSSSNIYGAGGSNIFSTSSSINIYNAPSKEGLLGSAVLECAHCAVSDLQVRELFLGQDSSGTSAASPSLNAWTPLCSTVRSKMVIDFPPDVPSAFSSGSRSVEGSPAAEEQAESATAHSPHSNEGAAGRLDIIEDAPLGLRLLKSIRTGGKRDTSCIELVGRGRPKRV